MNMHNWSEPYIDQLQALLAKAEVTADSVKAVLNQPNTPYLSELYETTMVDNSYVEDCLSNNESSTSKTKTLKHKFIELSYSPNVKSKSSIKSLNEFKGLYVFGEEVNGTVVPVYVGISRVIYQRLRNHGWGKLKNNCTLAYLISKDQKISLCEAKLLVRNFKVFLHPEKEDYDLYFLEVAIAGILKTKWNSFRTH